MAGRRALAWPPQRIAGATALIIAVAIAFAIVHALVPALVVVLLGIVLATAAAPVLDAGVRRGIPRAASAAAVLALIAAAVLGAVALAVPLIVAQLSRIADELPALCARARAGLDGSGHVAVSRLVPAIVPSDCSPSRLFPPFALLASGVRTTQWLRAAAAGALGSMLVAYAWALERPYALRAALLHLPASRRSDLRALFAAAERRVGAYVRGQVVLSGIVGVFTYVAYGVMGIPNAAALAGLGACLEVIPLLGPLAALGAALLAAVPDHIALGPALAVFAAVQRLIVDYALMPAIMGRSVGVNPLVMLVSLAILGQLGGILGAMVAVPFAAVAQMLLERLMARAPTEATVAIGRDRISRLRYQAALLSLSVRRLARRRRSRVSGPVREAEEEIEALADAVCTLAARMPGDEERRP